MLYIFERDSREFDCEHHPSADANQIHIRSVDLGLFVRFRARRDERCRTDDVYNPAPGDVPPLIDVSVAETIPAPAFRCYVQCGVLRRKLHHRWRISGPFVVREPLS